jgi:hypothetical protein
MSRYPPLALGDARSVCALPDSSLLRVQLLHLFLWDGREWEPEARLYAADWLFRRRAELPEDLARVFSLEVEDDPGVKIGGTPILHSALAPIALYLPRAGSWMSAPQSRDRFTPPWQGYFWQAWVPYIRLALQAEGIPVNEEVLAGSGTAEDYLRVESEMPWRDSLFLVRQRLDHARRRSTLNAGLLHSLDRALLSVGLL